MLLTILPADEPSTRLISSADDVILDPAIWSVVAFTSPAAPYITALPLTILPAVEFLSKFNSSTEDIIADPFTLSPDALISPPAP